MASVVVPAYQEEGGIAATLTELDAMCQRLDGWAWEIIVVDDGSADDTYGAATMAAAGLSTLVRVLRHSVNTGLGGALRTGLSVSRGDMVLTVDCDLSYSVVTLEALVAKFEESHMDVVIASPYMEGGATVRVPRSLEVRSRAANAWLHAASLDDIHTLTGLVRAYNGPFVRSLSLKAVDADINVEIIYKAQLLRASIVEVPAVLDWSNLAVRAGRSKLLARRSRWNTYKQLVNGYLWRPFWFPSAAAAVLGLLGAALMVIERIDWGMVGVACILTAIVLMFQALSALQAKRYFEELYTQGTFLHRLMTDAPRSGSPVNHDEVEEFRAQI